MNTPMKKMQVLSLAIALALTSAAAFSQARQAIPAGPGMRAKLDANNDGVIDRGEAQKAPRLAARFDQLDLDKDGKLGLDERHHMGSKHRRGATGGSHGRMAAADTDKDGRISRAEMQAAQGRMTEHFDRMDVNKDGYLDPTDRQARVSQHRDEFFSRADANRDGRVTRNEFIVEQGARSAQRREHRDQRAQSAGKQVRARHAPTEQQRIAFAGKAFDRMDANKDGALTRVEFDTYKPQGHGMRHGMDESKMGAPKQ